MAVGEVHAAPGWKVENNGDREGMRAIYAERLKAQEEQMAAQQAQEAAKVQQVVIQPEEVAIQQPQSAIVQQVVLQPEEVAIQQPQIQNPSFSQQASKMHKLGAFFCVLGALVLIGTAGAGYAFHATSFCKDSFSGYISLITIGGIAGLGTLFLGIYLHRKPYLKDPAFVNQHFPLDDDNIEASIKKLLNTPGINHISDIAIDADVIRNYLFEQIIDWQNRSHSVIVEFANKFGWRPFELGIISMSTKFPYKEQALKDPFDKTPEKEILLNDVFFEDYGRLTLTQREEYQADLNMLGFNKGDLERSTTALLAPEDLASEVPIRDQLPMNDISNVRKFFSSENANRCDESDMAQTITETLQSWIRENGVKAFINEFGWKPITLGYLKPDESEIQQILKDWIVQKKEEADIFSFVKEFGWQPIELGYLKMDDPDCPFIKKYSEEVPNSQRRANEIAQFNEAHQAQLKRFGFIR